MSAIDPRDLVVLVDEDAAPLGTAPRAEVHTDATPLHLAFSCHVTNRDGSVLVTRRALVKRTWPGVWTNSFCGHPRPGEAIVDAVRRYAGHELGFELREIASALPGFRYRAVDASGIVENELCPVFVAVADGEPQPNAAEVMDLAWAEPHAVGSAVQATPWAFSPWFGLQAPSLPMYGLDAAEPR